MPRRRLTDEEKEFNKLQRELATATRANSDAYIERQRALHRLQQSRWAKANPDKIARYMDKWEAKNPDYFREHDRDRYAADPEKFKAKSRAYYQRNKDRINAARRAKRKTERELRKPAKKIKPAVLSPYRV